jgi:hypothetical protein
MGLERISNFGSITPPSHPIWHFGKAFFRSSIPVAVTLFLRFREEQRPVLLGARRGV